MNDIPLITVIVPVYTVEKKYLSECIDSILAQSLKDIELILVDDGASPQNANLLDEYAASDSRIRVLHGENGGAAVARNRGLKAASGKYVTFVDSDDYIDKENLKAVYERAESDNLELLMWGSYKCYGDKKVEYMPFKDDIPLFDVTKKRWLMLKTMAGSLPMYGYPCTGYGSGSCCSKLYRRDFLTSNELYYPEGIKRAEDVNFNIRVFHKVGRIGYLNRHFYYYRQLHSSATYSYRDGGIQVFTDALNCLKSYLDEAFGGRSGFGEAGAYEGFSADRELFYKVYYMRCMFFALESMDMDYLNPANKKPLKRRLQELKAVLKTEPYRSAITSLSYVDVSGLKKIPLYLMKHRYVYLLSAFYSAYRKVQ